MEQQQQQQHQQQQQKQQSQLLLSCRFDPAIKTLLAIPVGTFVNALLVESVKRKVLQEKHVLSKFHKEQIYTCLRIVL